ncbi:MAG TPA: hypothetical protein VM638_07810 [Actinomycetota bacterium]|nr:hypothetical protein [Actinomycetota bacterium]
MRRALALSLAVLAGACGGGAEDPPADRRGGGLVAQVASYEPLAGEDNRLIVGLLTEDNLFVSGGTATFRFSYLGEEGAAPVPGPEVQAGFLPIAEPGAVPPPEQPTVGGATDVGRGVYAARGVRFDRAGLWEVEVIATIDGEERRATSAFTVLEEPLVPGVGERAPRTKNLTIHDGDAPPQAIDSRAETEGEVPDPDLHDTTIAAAIRRGRPVLAVFATPVYCVSRFCGPITDMVAGLRERWGDRVEIIHVEIWRDFQEQVVNKGAAEWVLREDNLTEPWIFLIDGDGRIAARWDNVATPGEIEPELERVTGG